MGPRSCRSLGSSGARRVRCLCECGFFGVARGEKDRRERFDASGPLGSRRDEARRRQRRGRAMGRSDSSRFFRVLWGNRKRGGGGRSQPMSHSWPAGLGLAGSLNSSEFVFRFCYFFAVFLLVIVLFYSLRPKINTILDFKICLKNVYFDPPTTEDKLIFRRFSQKTTNTSFIHHKRQNILIILHLVLVCVLNYKIIFILRRRE